MADRLFIRLCSSNPQRRVLLELVSTGECSGRLLAGALGRHWPEVQWYWAALPLAEIERLPDAGEIFLGDMPMGGAADSAGAQHPGSHEPAVLVVVDGPDPGGRLPLRRGLHSLGRGDVDFPVADPLLSRRHAAVRVSTTSITLADEGSANGTWCAGARIRERRLLIGDRFAAGGSTFALLAAQPRETGRGPWPLQPIAVEGQEPASRPGLVLIAALTPLALGLGLYLMTGSSFFLLFATLSLLTGGAPAFFLFRARRVFRRATAVARALDAARRDELAAPLGAVAAGLCRVPSALAEGFPPVVPGQAVQRAWLGSASATGPAPARPGTGSGRRKHDDPQPAPVLLHLRDGLVVALEGSASQRDGLLRALLVRWLPLLHSGALRVVVLGSAPFLPAEFLMLAGVELGGVELGEVGSGDATAPAPAPVLDLPAGRVPTVVLVAGHGGGLPVDAPQPRTGQGPAHASAAAPVAWVYCDGLPRVVRAQITIRTSGTLLLDDTALAHNPWLAADVRGAGLGFTPASLGFEALARAIRRESAAGTGPASGTQQAVLVQASPAVSGGPAAGHRPSLGTVMGDGASGPVQLDLLRHGPHVLVAGTTGSGKSELLRSLVLGLAANHGPDELAFMLVDFKGGATLAPLAALPQVQNLVSDLDAAAARRVLEQLSCELHRRERLLAAHDATDLADYRRSRTEADPLLPALVVVIDEFRVFSTELPGALEQIVQVATVGRSLGIHLVLSTQRPAGTLNAQLRANISAVVALRTMGDFESIDLIGSDAAAHLDPEAPGWAFLRIGGEAPEKFRVRINAQTGAAAHVRSWGKSLRAPLWQLVLDDQEPAAQESSPSRFDGLDPGRKAPGTGPGAGLGARVEHLRRAFSGSERAQNPFSPALPGTLLQLPRAALRTVPEHVAAIGLLDRVESAQPSAMLFDIRACSRLAVCGLPGSGVDAVPTVLARALNRSSWTAPCFVLDGTGTQPRLSGQPGVTGYFGPQDAWRIHELVLQLGDGADTGPLVLLVCGLGSWAQLLGPAAFGQLEFALGDFARTAQASGRALVLCGDRELSGSRIASLCESRWYFPRGAGPEVLMGWPKLKQVSAQPGRGLLVGPGEPETGTEFQLLDAAAELGRPQGAPPPEWIRSMPLPVTLGPAGLAALEAADRASAPSGAPATVRPSSPEPQPRTGSGPRALALPLGVCGPENRVFWWSPGPCGILIGHEGSGKGALLSHLAAWRLPGNRTCVRFGPEDALPSDLSHPTTGPGNLGPVNAGQGSTGSAGVGLVLLDRADLRPVEAARFLALLGAQRIPVVLSTEPSSRILMELGVGAAVRDQRSFVVLDPRSPADADPAGFRFVPDPRSVPGRALISDGGTLRQIQCVNDA